MVLLLLFLYNLVHKCLLFDGITIQLKMMDYLKFITLGIVFLVGIAQSKTVPGQPVSPALKQYINNEVKRIEKMFTDKVDEIMETTRNENARLKRENNFLIKNMCKERRKSYKQISDLKNELKDTGKRFIREMKAFKDLTVTGLLEKTREIHALKDKIRFVKLASELPSGQVKRIYRVGDNSDQEKSDNSEITLRDLGSPSNLVRVAQKDESGGSWNTEPSFNGPCDTCNDKYRSRRMLNPASAAHVAFFARLTNKTPHLDPNQDIVFDHVVTNVGNGYHGNHGLFVAPVSGLYVISATVMSYLPGPTIHYSHAKLVKNGQLLALMGQHGVAVWDTSSMTIAVELQKGDDVAVQNSDYYNQTFWGDNFCTFSGFLLYENAGSPNLIGK